MFWNTTAKLKTCKYMSNIVNHFGSPILATFLVGQQKIILSSSLDTLDILWIFENQNSIKEFLGDILYPLISTG